VGQNVINYGLRSLVSAHVTCSVTNIFTGPSAISEWKTMAGFKISKSSILSVYKASVHFTVIAGCFWLLTCHLSLLHYRIEKLLDLEAEVLSVQVQMRSNMQFQLTSRL
jgi:hypothetical protein